MSFFRSVITLILVSLLVSVGCNGNVDSIKGNPPQQAEMRPPEPKGPGGGVMK